MDFETLQLLATVGGFLAVFLQTKWRGEANEKAIEDLSGQVRTDHKALAERIDILFGKHATLREEHASTSATVTALVPRVARTEQHVDALGRASGIGRPVDGSL